MRSCIAHGLLRYMDLTFKQDNRSYHSCTQSDSCFDDCIGETDVPLDTQEELETAD
jgi:hypothetical protein